MKTRNELEAAVRARDRVRAIELVRQIEQRLVREHHEQDAIERRVRALMAEVNQPGSSRAQANLSPAVWSCRSGSGRTASRNRATTASRPRGGVRPGLAPVW